MGAVAEYPVRFRIPGCPWSVAVDGQPGPPATRRRGELVVDQACLRSRASEVSDASMRKVKDIKQPLQCVETPLPTAESRESTDT